MIPALVDMKLDLSSDNTTTEIIADIIAIGTAVKWVRLAFGDYDAVAYVEAKDAQAVANTVLSINRVAGVASTNTRILV